MVSRGAAFVIWAAVAASAVFWAMRLLPQGMPVPAQATLVSTASAFNADLSRVFGAAPKRDELMPGSQLLTQPVTDARFQLIGVVAPRAAAAYAEGLAVIAFDGQAPKTYRVGAVVDGDLVLQRVEARAVSLGPAGQPAQVQLELPELPPPATGTLPPPQNSDQAVPPPNPPRPAGPGNLPAVPRPGLPARARQPA
jgi:general secretion pathway protein C